MLSKAGLNRFQQKVDRTQGTDACWEWTACKQYGYGLFSVGGRSRKAHRVAWEIANRRAIPQGVVVRHRCDNPGCVNPRHLCLGTQAERETK